MLSIIPADTVLAVAIKDATITTSTVNPARITTTVQKMRPDWSVNKRRVKRLLRSMNNDAWKAAVGPPTPGTDTEATTSAPGAETEAIAPVPPPEPTTRGKVASKAAKAAKAAEKAVKAADKAAAKAAAAAAAVGEVCDTAPASPGSPATSTTAVREGSPAVGSVSVVAADSLGERAAATSAAPASSAAIIGADGAAAGTTAAPWDETNGVAESGEGAEEPLSESLRLEPDLELEATTVESLKADLGLPTITTDGENASRGFEMNEAVEGEGEVASSNKPAFEGVDSVVGPSGRADDLGFEMIDKAEALGAAPAVDVGAAPTGVDGANGKVARKVWPWSWGRS